MKLSEAIRLGSMLKEQGFGYVSNGRKTCTLGAALDAVGDLEKFHRGHSTAIALIQKNFPISEITVVCPICTGVEDIIERMIAHLNDIHMMKREEIADWLEGIENEHQVHPLREFQSELVGTNK